MRWSSFARRLALATAVLNLLVVGMTLLWLQHSRDQYRDDAKTKADNLAQVLQASLTGAIRHIDLAMLTVADEYPRLAAAGPGRDRALGELLARQQGHLPEIESLRVADRDGNVRYGLGVRPGVNVADRDYFIAARDRVDDGLVLSRPMFARISKKWVIVFARRVAAADGSFDGVVYVNLALERLSRDLAALDIGPAGSVSLRDGELGIIAQMPERLPLEKAIGNRTVSTALRELVDTGERAGSYVSATSHDQVERAAAFRRLDPYPLFVTIGFAEQDYLAPWRQELGVGVASAALFVLVTLSSAWLLVRAWRRQEATAAELAASERELKTIIATEPECVKLLDADCHLLRMNDAGLRMIDAESETQVRGQDVSTLVAPGDREAFRVLTRQVFEGASGTLEFEVVSLKGRHLWLETHATPLRDAAGRIVALLAVTRDTTERHHSEALVRRLNEELEQRVALRTAQLEAANKELEEFSYSMSHDLRTPLRAITGFASILLDEHGSRLDAEGQRLLRVVSENAGHMGRLVDDLLRFLGMARRKFKPGPVDLAELAGAEFAALGAAGRDGVAVRLILQALPPAWGDSDMLRQLLRELLANAIKYAAPARPAVIEVGGAEAEGEDVYYVRDNGVGFDMRYADKLFKVFERVHPTGLYQGSGIGLAMVKRIVDRHGGRVWAEGCPDAGATFHFALPCRQAVAPT